MYDNWRKQEFDFKELSSVILKAWAAVEIERMVLQQMQEIHACREADLALQVQ